MLQEIHKGVFCNPHEVEYVKLQPNLDTLVKLKHGAEIIIVGDVVDSVIEKINDALTPKFSYKVSYPLRDWIEQHPNKTS